MDRLRSLVAAAPSGSLALAAFAFAAIGVQRPDNRWAAWEWVLVGVIFALSAVASYGDRRGRLTTAHRRHDGLCPACGYDTRATPNRCPECGSRIP